MGSLRLPTPEEALPGRAEQMRVPPRHTVLGAPLQAPVPEGSERALFGLGCFWGAERKFWELDGVYTTAVGYAGGHTKNPTHSEVCSGARPAARPSREAYQRALEASRHGRITTEIANEPPFYYAEDYHQQYLAKNPGGYCGLGGTGVSCPVGNPGTPYAIQPGTSGIVAK